MSELREGLADHLYGVIPFGECTRNDAEALADSVLAYLHAHDGHAEFVRHKCGWTEEHDGDTWATGCGNMFQFFAGGPSHNNFRFCCYCGNEIAEEALCDAELAKEMSNG